MEIERKPFCHALCAAQSTRPSTALSSKAAGAKFCVHDHRGSAIQIGTSEGLFLVGDPIWVGCGLCGPTRAQNGHGSPAGAVSIGPGVLDRSYSAIRSSVRSHRIVGSRRREPRRHLCRPPATVCLFGTRLLYGRARRQRRVGRGMARDGAERRNDRAVARRAARKAGDTPNIGV